PVRDGAAGKWHSASGGGNSHPLLAARQSRRRWLQAHSNRQHRSSDIDPRDRPRRARSLRLRFIVASRARGCAMAFYDAFISYSHARDKPIAARLQSTIQKLGKPPWYRRRALRLFRDDTSLSATPHLWPMIEQTLGQSRFLILFASPEAAASPWVNKEVAYWLDHKSEYTLLIAVTSGDLAWDNTRGD